MSERKMSRRDFGKLATAAAIGLSIPGDGVRDSLNQKESKKHEQLKIHHRVTMSPEVKTVIERGGFADVHMGMIEQYFKEKGIPEIKKNILKSHPSATGDVNLNADIRTAAVDIKPLKEMEEGAEIIAEGRKAIEDATAFWDHPELVRPTSIDFRLPKNHEQKDFKAFPDDKRVEIDIIEEQGIRYKGQVKGEIDSKTELWDINLFVHNLAGSVTRRPEVVRQANGSQVIEWHHSQIFWVLNGDKASSPDLTRILPTEILHLQLSQFVEQRQTAEILSSGSMQTTEKTLRPMKLGEAVVHSIGQLWFEEYRKKNGNPITEKERATILNSTYPGVRVLYERLKKGGHAEVKKMIDEFIHNPEKLYTETGI